MTQIIYFLTQSAIILTKKIKTYPDNAIINYYKITNCSIDIGYVFLYIFYFFLAIFILSHLRSCNPVTGFFLVS